MLPPAVAALAEPADLKSTGPLPPTPTSVALPAPRGDVEAATTAAPAPALPSALASARSSPRSVTPRAPRPIQALSGVGVLRRGEFDDRRLCSTSLLLPPSLPPVRLLASFENFSSVVGGAAGGGGAAKLRPDRTASGGGDGGGAIPDLVLTGVAVVTVVVVAWLFLALVAVLFVLDNAFGGAVSGGAIAVGRNRLRLLLRLLLRAGLLLVLLAPTLPLVPALPLGVLLRVGAGGARVADAVSKRRRLS